MSRKRDATFHGEKKIVQTGQNEKGMTSQRHGVILSHHCLIALVFFALMHHQLAQASMLINYCTSRSNFKSAGQHAGEFFLMFL